MDFVEAKLKACRAVVEYIGEGDGEELLGYFLRGKHEFGDDNIKDCMLDKKVYSPDRYRALRNSQLLRYCSLSSIEANKLNIYIKLCNIPTGYGW